MLSTDAVKIVPGSKVILDRWGGDPSIEGRVRVVEPGGFTKISALGVEEQRVRVIVDFTSPRAACCSRVPSAMRSSSCGAISLNSGITVGVWATGPASGRYTIKSKATYQKSTTQ